jgi:DNA-binding transcriptional ArsR family regulator
MAYATAMDALGDATRREIMERLRGGPRPVGEIAAGLQVSRPAVSQHLRVLREAGLVAERKEGTRRIYRVEPQGLADLRAYLDSFWEQALAGFRAAAEKEGRRE